MESLPNETILEIILFCNFETVVKCLILVCTRFNWLLVNNRKIIFEYFKKKFDYSIKFIVRRDLEYTEFIREYFSFKRAESVISSVVLYSKNGLSPYEEKFIDIPIKNEGNPVYFNIKKK